MASSLRHVLENLPSDGQHPVQTRKAALNDLLINGLTHDEMRYVQTRLEEESFRLLKDICASLPVELLISITQYFDLEDILRARQVSHKWNVQFSSHDFYVGVAKHHFQGAWERELKKLASFEESRVSEKDLLETWLLDTIKRRIRRRRGCAYKISSFHNEWAKDYSSRADNEREYCNGRVAFPHDGAVIVTSLVDSIELKFRDPDRLNLEKWVLSDKYLIAKKSNSRTILAWPLAGQNNGSVCYSVQIHTGVKLFSASGNHVGLVTKTNEILMWDIQGTVREIQPSREELGDAFALFFQPDDEDCFLVFYDDETRIIVQEIRSGEERGVFIYHLPGDLVRPQNGAPGTGATRSEEYSTNTDTLLPSAMAVDTDGFGIAWENRKNLLYHDTTALLNFNIYTKKFNLRRLDHSDILLHARGRNRQERPGTGSVLEFKQCLCWREQILVPCLRPTLGVGEHNDSPSRPKDALLLAMDLPRNCSEPGSEKPVASGFWCGEEGCESDDSIWYRYNYPSERAVAGDDDYVVMFGNYGFVVWYFN